MEGLTFNDGVEELKTKFWPTYKVRLLFITHMTSGDLSLCAGGIDSVAYSSNYKLLFSTASIPNAVCKPCPSLLDHVPLVHEALIVTI